MTTITETTIFDMATAATYPQGTSLDIRVEDFLDDKLQSFDDIEELDTLLENVELQRNQLQSQLDTAVKELEETRRTADDRGTPARDDRVQRRGI